MYKYGIKCEGEVCDFLSKKKYFSGVKLVPGSGKNFNKKEDIKSDDKLIQVKSTKDKSYTLKSIDFKKLLSNSIKTKKSPVFIVYFSESKNIKIILPYLDYLDNLDNYLNNNIFLEQFIITPKHYIKDDNVRMKISINSQDYFVLNYYDFI